MADLSTLRGSLGEVEFFLLKDWTSFQCELLLFYRDIDASSSATAEDTPLRLAASADARGGYTSRFGVASR
jgi:hypothetical protein